MTRLRQTFVQILPVAAALLLLLTGGCAPWTTWPPIDGAGGIDYPAAPVPGLMAKAIGHVHEQRAEQGGVDEIITINLPPEMPDSVWDQVLESLEPSRPLEQAGEFAYHIAEVRVRALNAEVDVVYPRGGVAQMTTVRFRAEPWGPYEVTNVKRWHIAVDAPAPDPRFADGVEAWRQRREADRRRRHGIEPEPDSPPQS